MAKTEPTIALRADPADPDDFDVTEDALDHALVDRQMRRRGAQKAPIKQAVSLRLDADVVARWRASGPGWQSRANDALRAAAP